ncbi:CDP-diacylglycerol--serine O-phosphatidyltransferase, partial [Streptomyces sp. A73]|nr:CDP-diacylglycerol--serine O-phosphatidyltransferase [Streptomyces sp. A73]
MTVIDPDAQAAWVPAAERSTDREDDFAGYAEYADDDYADDADDEMPLSTRLSIADTLTLGNATCGFMAVYFTTTGVLIPHLTGSEDGGM